MRKEFVLEVCWIDKDAIPPILGFKIQMLNQTKTYTIFFYVQI